MNVSAQLMGSRERRRRARSALRKVILVAAREMFLARGVRNVSLRQIAERIGYSPAALYRYFRRKEDILLALAEEDFAVLPGRVHEATRHLVDPLERIRRVVWTVYEFLAGNPLLIELMLLDGSLTSMTPAHQRSGALCEIAAALEADVSRYIERGQMSIALTAAETCRLLFLGIFGAAVAHKHVAGDKDCGPRAYHLLETLLAGLSMTPMRPAALRSAGHGSSA